MFTSRTCTYFIIHPALPLVELSEAEHLDQEQHFLTSTDLHKNNKVNMFVYEDITSFGTKVKKGHLNPNNMKSDVYMM